ncbi:UNVERIFIED_CONTAM: hypothetical protein GTU68_014987 [Idotea baltica]|nr:hypothetical protein [Idotea baltica]
MKKLIECVPNFSEGRDMAVIEQITAEIKSVEGVSLLDVDPGASTNRTVVTIVGEPGPVIEAAFRAIRKASQLIDMSKHTGAHPRMGATDVCPLIPISGVTFDECVTYAQQLGQRVGDELGIPIYLYEKAATAANRQNLAVLRAGEYEGFAEKISLPEWKPDYGPQQFNAKTGQTAIGVRDFLIAYNVNLNTKSVRRANSVAFDVREKGNTVREPGTLKAVKGIGWYVEEYGIAQVSMNLTDVSVTPLHKAFEACEESAFKRGLRASGSEVVGLLPLKAMLDAGRYFLRKQNWSEGASDEDLIHIAVKSMGLDELYPFDPQEKIIEYKIADANAKRLVDMDLRSFCNETLSDSPAPGGGSVSALVGAVGISLGGMVANLSAGKRGWDNRLPEFSAAAVEAQALKDTLLHQVDEDTNAFNKVMDAIRLPKGSDAEKAARSLAMQNANQYAAEVPYQVMATAFEAYDLLLRMAKDGNPASVTDAGVGALCIHTCIQGASMNVRINLGGIKDEAFKADISQKVADCLAASDLAKAEVLAVVETKMP